MRKRQVTDIWALIVFAVAITFASMFSGFAIYNGRPSRLFKPMDSKGQFCEETDSTKKNLFIKDYTSISITKSLLSLIFKHQIVLSSNSICVESCPSYLGPASVAQHVCERAVQINDDATLAVEIASGNCQAFNIPTIEFFNYCIIDFSQILTSKMTYADLMKNVKMDSLSELVSAPVVLAQQKMVSEIVEDFNTIKYFFIVYVVICYVITLILILLLGYGTFPIFLILYIVGFLVLSAVFSLSVVSYVKDTKNADLPDVNQWINSQINTNLFTWKYRTNIIILIILAFVLFLMLVFALYFFKVVKIAAKYAQEAGKTTIFLILNSLLPLIMLAVQLGVAILWIYITICIVTSNKNEFQFLKLDANGRIEVNNVCPAAQPDGSRPACTFSGMSISTLNMMMFSVISIVCLWVLVFINSVTTYLHAYSFYKCYKGEKIKLLIDLCTQLLNSVRTLILYNVGSVVVGSFIVMVAWAINIIFWLIKKTIGLKKTANKFIGFKIIQKLLGIMKYLVTQFQIMTIINVVVFKRNFFKSGVKVVEINLSNPTLSMFLGLFKTFYLVFGSIISATATATITYFHIRWYFPKVKQLVFFSIAVGLVCLVISVSILRMFTVGITTYFFNDYHNNKEKLDDMEKRASTPCE